MKIVCVALNYLDHALEVKAELPERPLLFAKWPSACIDSGEAIVIPPGVTTVDYEAELAAIVGTRVKRVSVENALEAIAGYTCLNDVSAREIQFGDGQWTRAKSFDTFCPMGPRIVPRDEVGDPQALHIQCRLNGDSVQDALTADMIFSVAEIVAFVSEAITLEPGDIIATGTPPVLRSGGRSRATSRTATSSRLRSKGSACWRIRSAPRAHRKAPLPGLFRSRAVAGDCGTILRQEAATTRVTIRHARSGRSPRRPPQ